MPRRSGLTNDVRLGRARRRAAGDGEGPAEARADSEVSLPVADAGDEAVEDAADDTGDDATGEPIPLVLVVESDDSDERGPDAVAVDGAGIAHELPEEVVSGPRRRGWWRRMSGRMGLGIRGAFRIRGKLDDEFYDDVLEALISADCGVATSERLVEQLRERVREDRIRDGAAALDALKAEILGLLRQRDRTLRIQHVPSVVLMVGVNGSGKTTTTGKMAYRLRQEGRIPLVAAADTYRAAAIDQMRIWADRAGVDVVAHQPGGDPGAVVYDAIQAAFARRVDCVLVDTAGRLHTKTNLMAELQKVRRVAERLIPEAPQETLLVLDATTGMNALAQGRAFHEAVQLTGLVLTKLDGSARGGTVLALEEELGVPVKLVGLGEGIDDLNVFDDEAYVDALFATNGQDPADDEA